MNHPLYMSHLALAEYVNWEMSAAPVLLAETWTNSKWADAVVITGPDRYEGFLQWQKFHRETGKDVAAYEHWVARKTDLHRHLLRQLEDSGLGSGSYRACRYMITRLTDEGYLRYNRNEAAEICYANSWDVELAEGMLRSMDPIGVGTADGEQCVRFQLKSGSQVIPKPGIRYRDRTAEPYVVPDIVIRRGREQADAFLDMTGIPMPRVDNRYRSVIPDLTDPTKIDFLSNCFREAEDLIYNLNVRNYFLLRAADVLTEANQDFFLGRQELPTEITSLKLSTETGIPLPEVEGILRGKYVRCGRDLYSLSYFLG